MKKLLILITFAPALLWAETQGLTLQQTCSKVLDANPSVREAVERIAAAEAVLKQARSAYMPTLTLSGSYGHVDASLHPDTNPYVRMSDGFMQSSAGLSSSWLLFDGFARQARALAARYGVEQSREMSQETRRLLILSATTTFRQAQLARQNIAIAERDFEFNTNLEQDARKRFEAGTLTESDVHNFSIRALQAKSTALKASLSYDTARAVMAELMALPQAQLPESMAPTAISFKPASSPIELEAQFSYALAHRPDYRALQTGQLALAQQARVAKGNMAPKVALVGDLNYTDRTGYVQTSQHGNYDSFVGVTASWDLFSGGRKVNAVKEAQAEMRALEQQRQALRLSIRSALSRRIIEAKTSFAIFQHQEKIYQLSESVRDSVEKAYKAGAASITRLNEAQTDLVRARGAHSTAYIAYQLTLNQLDVETGRVLEGF